MRDEDGNIVKAEAGPGGPRLQLLLTFVSYVTKVGHA